VPDARTDPGPSLPALIAALVRGLRPGQRFAFLAATLVIAAGVALALGRGDSTDVYGQSAADARARGLAPIPFHFAHPGDFQLTKPRDAYVSVERTLNGTLLGRLTVSELRLPRERAPVAALLPIAATTYERRAAQRYERFRLQFEGRARASEVEGYQFAFTARLQRRDRPARQLFGRVLLLPSPDETEEPRARVPGVVLTMLATTADGVYTPIRVGDEGVLREPFASFRFGER
jgi:hypothetical protein